MEEGTKAKTPMRTIQARVGKDFERNVKCETDDERQVPSREALIWSFVKETHKTTQFYSSSG